MFRIRIVTKDGYPNLDKTIDVDTVTMAKQFGRKCLKDGVLAEIENGKKFYLIPAEGIHYIIMEE